MLPLVGRYVAGEEINEAIDYCDELYRENDIVPIVNHLGEHYNEEEKAVEDKEEYLDLVNSLEKDYEISVKPTQLGLEISKDMFSDNLVEILQESENFVWVDMEDSSTVQETIEVIKELGESYDIGLCLQANLRRTTEDVDDLRDIRVRLVKGGYDEPEDIAYTKKSKINENYKKLIEKVHKKEDLDLELGTHDTEMIDHAYGFGSPPIQMLMGIREKKQRELSDERVVKQYVPYGSKWKSYFWRRMKSKKGNIKLAVESLIRG